MIVKGIGTLYEAVGVLFELPNLKRVVSLGACEVSPHS
jgi:hypothetical protein